MRGARELLAVALCLLGAAATRGLSRTRLRGGVDGACRSCRPSRSRSRRISCSGEFRPGEAPGTVELNVPQSSSGASRTSSGGVALAGSSFSAAEFSVSAHTGSPVHFTVALPPAITIQRIGGGESMRVDGFRSNIHQACPTGILSRARRTRSRSAPRFTSRRASGRAVTSARSPSPSTSCEHLALLRSAASGDNEENPMTSFRCLAAGGSGATRFRPRGDLDRFRFPFRRLPGGRPDSRRAAPASKPAAEPPAVAPADLPGIGDLLVAPTRIVFEGRTRAAELTLLNIGKQTATYRISFTHLRMGETGDLKEIEKAEPGDQFADDLVRYSPRQVTLDPNVAQTIRLQVRKPEGLADGEYRSHLLFRAVPPESSQPETSVEVAEKKTGYSIRLTPIYGVSIPVIVRSGKTSVKASLSDLAVQRAGEAGRSGEPRDEDPARRKRVRLREPARALHAAVGQGAGRRGAERSRRLYAERGAPRSDRSPAAARASRSRRAGCRVSYARAEQNGDVLAAAETALP